MDAMAVADVIWREQCAKWSHPVSGRACLLAILGTLLLFVAPAQLAAETQEGMKYVCRQLDEVLQDFRSQGLKVIYSSEWVRPEMQIKEAPEGHTLRELLDNVLQPFGLMAKDGGNGVLLVIANPESDLGRGSVPSSKLTTDDAEAPQEGVLPIWAKRSEVVEFTFPERSEPPAQVSPDSRFLTVRLTAVEYEDWAATAFDLKNLIVDARAVAPALKVALDGPSATTARLVTHGLAPYIDAYLYADDPSVPLVDPTARRWRRVAGDASSVLETLLLSGGRGDELVIFDDSRLDDLHETFLAQIQRTEGADLYEQPSVEGVDPSRTRFFQHPTTGDHYLAIYSQGPETLTFRLPQPQDARLLFPSGEGFEFESDWVGSRLTIDGTLPYYLFELKLYGPETEATEFEVTTDLFVDPYEEVVKNQVFQERQYERFESLDVMEYINSVGQWAGGSRTQWEHRLIERKGHLTDYHHLGYSINGAPYPTKKLLKGRLYRNEALLRLRPLEVELDKTYRYEYLGQETINGHPTYKIGYKPLADVSSEGGSYVSGVLWLDQETHAHHRVRTVQRATQDGVLTDEGVYHYGWIPSNGECWWDWTERKGSATFSDSGQIYGSKSSTTRKDFKFNRPDIEQVVAEAYASDIMIHVETPPDGHRWLVKDKEHGRRLEDPTALGVEQQQQVALASLPSQKGAGVGTPSEGRSTPDYGPRSLADIHAYSNHGSFSILGIDTGSDTFDFYPGITLSSDDLFRTGSTGWVGIFRDDLQLGLGVPNFLRDSWSLSVGLYLPYDADVRESTVLADGELFDTSVDFVDHSLSLSLSMPLNRRTGFSFTYALTRLDFEPIERTSSRFILPTDTYEHSVDVGLATRWANYTAEVGLEHGFRQDWNPWGIDGLAETYDEFEVFRASIGGFWKVGQNDNLSVALAYQQGEDLDRFSRRRNGRSRIGIVGFGNATGYDGSIAASMTWGTHVWKVPINLRLTTSSEWLDALDYPDDRTWLRFRFLINAPFKLDVWPSVSYMIDSSVPGESDEVSYGISLGRRQ
ncbi:MAG: outer membrane lipoprotein-sorting protein [Thermoanaerobaculia bacterium]|nr:outer membrane lipoprotein-sorting protein [Thermoanaerobaculia bacterium]